MSANQTAIEIECRKDGLDIVEYPLYRIAKAIQAFFSLASIPLLLYVQIRYIFGSIFHRNIKIVLLMYYSMVLFHSTTLAAIEIYELINSLVKEPCDFFFPIYLYTVVHLCHTLSYQSLNVGLVSICCERTVATIRSKKYESNGIVLGLSLLVGAIVAIFAIAVYLYKFDDFNTKVWSMTVIPPDAVKRAKYFGFGNIIISFICIVVLHIWSRINRKLCLVSNSTLTSRFQTRENIITTEFAAQIASLQVLFFVITGVCGIFIRAYTEELCPNNKRFCISIRHLCYLVPMFTFVLPIYSIRRLNYYRSHRHRNIRSIVMMESRGVAGARNYEEIIAKSWQQR